MMSSENQSELEPVNQSPAEPTAQIAVSEDDPKSAPEGRAAEGPYDLAEVPAIRPYVDLGAIKVLPREGLQIRIDVEEGTKRLVAVSLDLNGSTLQVQAFSAPKGSGVWLSIVEQIATQLESQGVSVARSDGPFGPELETVADGQLASMRFVGVDGPRWVLRGTITGAALTEEDRRSEIESLFRGLVVVRGEMPMPPRELLPLRLPPGASAS